MPAATSCLPDETLRSFALGHLDTVVGSSVAIHIEACPRCRAVVAGAGADGFVDRLRSARIVDGTPPPPKALDETADWARSAARIDHTQLELGVPVAVAVDAPELAGLTDYRVIRRLGKGGMGAVYLARNAHLDKDYVLKVILPQFLTSPGLAERFVREIRAAVAIGHHPNIVTAYPPLSSAGGLVHVMEYVVGKDLAQVVAEHGPLPIIHACSYVGQAAKGLQHALDKGLIHRDIKPQNLMLTRENGKRVVKVADFGLAKRVGSSADEGLTDTGTAMGTPDYVAPEQARDATQADTRSDVYSLGCTLYYLLAGRVPFPGGNVTEKMLKQLLDTPTPIRELRPDVPEELATVLGRMMAKEPAARYQTPGEAMKAVAPFTQPAKKSGEDPQNPDSATQPSNVAESGSLVFPAFTNEKRAVARPEGRGRWKWVVGSAAGVVSVAFLLAFAGGLFIAKTPNGSVVVENVPADADVTVEGEAATVRRSGDTVTLSALREGKYRLRAVARGTDLKLSETEVVVGRVGVRVRVLDAPRPTPAPTESFSAVPIQHDADTSPGPPREHPLEVLPDPAEYPRILMAEAVPSPRPILPPPSLPERQPIPAAPPKTEPGEMAPRVEGEDGWIPLFNGRNLSGWKTHPSAHGNWSVRDGILVGRGPVRNHLYTEQGDYTDFQLRVETRINAGGNSGLRFRKAFSEDKLTGYEAQIDSSTKDIKTGSLYVGGNKPPVAVHEVIVPVDTWFTEEVVCRGNRIAVLVNGREVVNYTDPDYTWTKGHIALQVWQPPTVAEFRRIEVKRLTPTPAAAPTTTPPPNRKLWVHGTGDGTQTPVGLFRQADDKTWYESVSLPKSVGLYCYAETNDNPDYVELKREVPTRVEVRLYADRAEFAFDGKPFVRQYGGGWKKPPSGPPTLASGSVSPFVIGSQAKPLFTPNGVAVRAGSSSGSVATSRTDFIECEVVATLAASKGAEAFLVRRNDRDPAITARVFDDKAAIRAGHHGRKFSKDERGFGQKSYAYDQFFTLKLYTGEGRKDLSVAQVTCDGVRTSSLTVRDDSLRTGGACGVVVSAGEVTIRSLEVNKLNP